MLWYRRLTRRFIFALGEMTHLARAIEGVSEKAVEYFWKAFTFLCLCVSEALLRSCLKLASQRRESPQPDDMSLCERRGYSLEKVSVSVWGRRSHRYKVILQEEMPRVEMCTLCKNKKLWISKTHLNKVYKEYTVSYYYFLVVLAINPINNDTIVLTNLIAEIC